MPLPDRLRCHPALFVAAALLLGGCSKAPVQPPAGRPTAHADHDDHDHDDEHGEHEHADHDHDHADHDHPDTLAEGVAELERVAAAVKTHLDAGTRDDADEAVHAMGHLLEDLQGLVRTSTLAAEAKAAASKALDDLFECFDQLDTALHANPGEGTPPAEVHASIAARVEAAIAALRGAGRTQPAAEEPDDDAAAIIRAAKQAEENR